jgi:hypothetical protein
MLTIITKETREKINLCFNQYMYACMHFIYYVLNAFVFSIKYFSSRIRRFLRTLRIIITCKPLKITRFLYEPSRLILNNNKKEQSFIHPCLSDKAQCELCEQMNTSIYVGKCHHIILSFNKDKTSKQ